MKHFAHQKYYPALLWTSLFGCVSKYALQDLIGFDLNFKLNAYIVPFLWAAEDNNIYAHVTVLHTCLQYSCLIVAVPYLLQYSWTEIVDTSCRTKKQAPAGSDHVIQIPVSDPSRSTQDNYFLIFDCDSASGILR